MRQEPEFAAQPAQPRRTAFAEQHEPAEQRPVAHEAFKEQAAPGARRWRHVMAPWASEKRPAPQGAQTVAAATPEAVPTGHAVHTAAKEAPVASLYIPGGQGTGGVLPGQKNPAGQGRVSPLSQEKPTGHTDAIEAVEEAHSEGEADDDVVAQGLAVRFSDAVCDVVPDTVRFVDAVCDAEPDTVGLNDAETAEESEGVGHSLLVAEEEGEEDGVLVLVAVVQGDPEDENVMPVWKDTVDCKDGEVVKETETVVHPESVTVPAAAMLAEPVAVACLDGVAVPLAVALGEEEGEAVDETLTPDWRLDVTTAMNPRYSSTASVVHCRVRKRPVVVHELAVGTEKPEIPAPLPLFIAGLLTLEPSYRKS